MKSVKIEVIGSGCKKCKALFDLTIEVSKELGIKDAVEYSTDVTKIATMGMMSSPLLAINGKAVLAGVLPDKEKLKQIISASIFGSSEETKNMDVKNKDDKKCEGCKCGDKC